MGKYADHIGRDQLTMIGVVGMDIPRLASTGQTRLLHHALHPFVINLPALPQEGFRHPTIAVVLDAATAMLVIPSPIDVEQATQLAHRYARHQLPQPLYERVARYGWELMPGFGQYISANLLIFCKNICAIMSGEAQLGRSQLETIPQNPRQALELDS